MRSLRLLAFRSVLSLSTTLLIACTRERIVDRPVQIPVPVVKVIDRKCPASLPPLPERPRRTSSELCNKTFGSGAICYEPVDAVRLGALLTMLTDLYLERAACDVDSHVNTNESLETPLLKP